MKYASGQSVTNFNVQSHASHLRVLNWDPGRYDEGTQVGQMSDDDDISSFLSRPLPALSDICVQFITPGNAPGPNSGPVGTFQWMRTVWKPDVATIWVFGQKAAHGEWRRRSRGIYCENNALSPHSRFFHPSVRNTNTPNQTNINFKGETVCPDWNWLQNWENNMWYICFFGIHNVPKYKRTHIEMTILKKINLRRKP